MPRWRSSVSLTADGFGHQRIAFPVADGIAHEGGVRVFLVRAPVGPDRAGLHPGFLVDRDPPRREDEFERILERSA